MATLSESAQRIRPGVFAELQARIDAHSAKGGTLVPLQIGDTHLAPPADARFARAIGDDAKDELYRYGATAGLAELRDAIATRARELYGIPNASGAANVHVGAGGTHALFCAARAVLDAGDEVLVAAPYWPLSVGIFHGCSARPIEVPLTSAALRRSLARRRFDLRCGHHAAHQGALLHFAEQPRRQGPRARAAGVDRARGAGNDLWVFADEVYAEVTYGEPHVSIASLPGMAERTIVVQSFSKSYALAGARVGAVVAPEPVIAAARRVGSTRCSTCRWRCSARRSVRCGPVTPGCARRVTSTGSRATRRSRRWRARACGSRSRKGRHTCSSISAPCSTAVRSGSRWSVRSITACSSRLAKRSAATTQERAPVFHRHPTPAPRRRYRAPARGDRFARARLTLTRRARRAPSRTSRPSCAAAPSTSA